MSYTEIPPPEEGGGRACGLFPKAFSPFSLFSPNPIPVNTCRIYAAKTNLTWLFGDHLGSTSITADFDGDLISRTLYKPWGEVRYQSGTLPTKYTYTGQYSHTADFGLMYYVARWYDPVLGRFAQADTLVPGAGHPMAWDRYAYALNSPVRNVDPSGHRTCSAEDAATGDETCDQNSTDIWYLTNLIYDELAHVDDVEAMAQIAELAITFYDDPVDIFSFLSEVFIGIDSFNPLTLLEAAINRGLNPKDSGLDFGATGFHPDFVDEGNQVFHVWAYIIQGWWTIPGGLIGEAGNRFHEFGPSFGQGGQSQKDYDLAHSGLVLGTLIGWGIIPLNQLGNGIRYMFGEGGPGANIP